MDAMRLPAPMLRETVKRLNNVSEALVLGELANTMANLVRSCFEKGICYASYWVEVDS